MSQITRTDAPHPRPKRHDWPDVILTEAGTYYDFFGQCLRGLVGVESGTTTYQLDCKGAFGVDYVKADGEVHEVRRQGETITCTCPDYRFKRGPSGTRCKHGQHAVFTRLLR